MHREGGENQRQNIKLLEVEPGRGHFCGGQGREVCPPFIHHYLFTTLSGERAVGVRMDDGSINLRW